MITNTPAPANHALRETGELTINIPALPRPTLAQIQAKDDWITSIEQDTSCEGAVTLVLASVLREGERASISGKEYERRVRSHQGFLLGFQHQQWLFEHQAEFPEFMALLGRVYLDFPGIVVLDRGGDRFVPCAGQDGRRWDDRWHWLDYGFDSRGRVAVSRR